MDFEKRLELGIYDSKQLIKNEAIRLLNNDYEWEKFKDFYVKYRFELTTDMLDQRHSLKLLEWMLEQKVWDADELQDHLVNGGPVLVYEYLLKRDPTLPITTNRPFGLLNCAVKAKDWETALLLISKPDCEPYHGWIIKTADMALREGQAEFFTLLMAHPSFVADERPVLFQDSDYFRTPDMWRTDWEIISKTCGQEYLNCIIYTIDLLEDSDPKFLPAFKRIAADFNPREKSWATSVIAYHTRRAERLPFLTHLLEQPRFFDLAIGYFANPITDSFNYPYFLVHYIKTEAQVKAFNPEIIYYSVFYNDGRFHNKCSENMPARIEAGIILGYLLLVSSGFFKLTAESKFISITSKLPLELQYMMAGLVASANMGLIFTGLEMGHILDYVLKKQADPWGVSRIPLLIKLHYFKDNVLDSLYYEGEWIVEEE